MLRRPTRFHVFILTLACGLLEWLHGSMARADVMPLVSGDESIVSTTHQIKTAKGVLKYEARAGRLPIRLS